MRQSARYSRLFAAAKSSFRCVTLLRLKGMGRWTQSAIAPAGMERAGLSSEALL